MAKGRIKGVSIEKQQKAFETAIRQGFRDAVTFWQKTFARGHFSPNARFKYSYAPRSKAYEARKKKKYGHNLPLVWTGATRRTIQSRFARPTVQKIRATGMFRVRKNLGVRIFARQQELVETIPKELEAMGDVVVGVVEEALKKRTFNTEVRV